MPKIKVEGKKTHDIMIYALSTCGWCKKTKEFLSNLGVEYCYTDVDLLEGNEQEEATAQIDHWNPDGGFPTIVINNKKCIVGFNAEELKEELSK